MKNIIKMKAIQRIAGIIVLAAIIGFSMAACSDDGGSSGSGGGGLSGTTWNCTTSGVTATLTFTSSSRVRLEASGQAFNGNYTLNGSSGTINWDDGDRDTIVVNGNSLTMSGQLTFTKTGGGNTGGGGTGGGSGSGGTFTLTGIPSKYNGKYALIAGTGPDDSNLVLIGYQNVDPLVSALISNGTVSIPMWVFGSPLKRYSGNDTCPHLDVVIHTSQYPSSGGDMIAQINFSYPPVTFSNGSASRSWSAGTAYEL